MKRIKRGEPQPLNCPECNDKMGYKVSDYIKIHYTSFYKSDGSDGSDDGGMYSEYGRVINKGVTALCLNCNARLPFRINVDEK